MKIDTVKECIDYLDEVGELDKIKAQAIEEMLKNMKQLLDDEGRLFDYEILDYAYIVRTNGYV